MSVVRAGPLSVHGDYARNSSSAANPNLWNGLRGLWMPALGIYGGKRLPNIVTGQDAVQGNAAALSYWQVVGEYPCMALGGAYSAAETYYDTISDLPDTLFSADFTLCGLVRMDPTPNSQNILFSKDEATGGDGISFRWLKSGNKFRVKIDGSNKDFSSAWASDQWQVFCCRRLESSVNVWFDGVKHGTTNTKGSSAARTEDAAIGTRSSGESDRLFEGGVGMVAVWERSLMEPEIQAISADPFSIVRPRNRSRTWFVEPAAATGPHYYRWRQRVA